VFERQKPAAGGRADLKATGRGRRKGLITRAWVGV